jgi:hypothetical protein
MIRPVITAAVFTSLITLLTKTGGVSELFSFVISKDTPLVGTVVINLLIVIIFSELYLALDKSGEDGEHFGFSDALDAYYFTAVTTSSVGYGDILPKSRKAKLLTLFHILTFFLVGFPIILKALESGN